MPTPFRTLPTLSGRLAWIVQIGYTTARLFAQNGLQFHAAAATFFFLLSATPLLLLLSYALQGLSQLAANSVPATILMAALYEQLHIETLTAYGLIPQRAQLAASGVGLVTLVLSSRGLVHAVQGAFQMIFPHPHKRNLVLNWALPFIILPVLFLLGGLAALVQLTLGFLAEYGFLGTGNALAFQSINVLFGTVMLWGLLFAAYWQLPRQHPRMRDAALFAGLATLSLVLLFIVFRAFFKLENYQSLYGALGSVIFVLMAGYFAFLLLYIWAQALYAYGKADLTALEKLFLAGQGSGASKLEGYVFSDASRLLARYGKTHPDGHVLIREGETDRTAYFLYDGRAAVFKHTETGEKKLGELNAGQLFGEMAYLLDEPRTASVIASGEITVLALPPAVLEELMRHSAPLSRRIIDTLCQRLERMNLATR